MVEIVVVPVSTKKNAQNVLVLIISPPKHLLTLLLEMVSAMMKQTMLTAIMMVEIVVELVSILNVV